MNDSHATRIETHLRSFQRRWKVVQLHQLVIGERASMVGEYHLDEAENLRQVAERIDADLRRDANDVTGLCKYAVVAIGADGSRGERFVLRQRGEGLEGDAGSEEPPTAAGLVAQSMRHSEVSMRMAFESIHSSHRNLLSENARLSELVERLEGRRFDTLELQESMMSEQHTRELEAARDARSAKHQEQIMTSIVGPLTPRLVEAFLGKFFPKDARLERVVRFLSGISSEQLGKMLDGDVLRTEQQAELVELLRHLSGEPAASVGEAKTN